MSDDAPTPTPPLVELSQRMAAVDPGWRVAPDVAASALERSSGHALRRGVAVGVESIREGWLLHRDATRLLPGAEPHLTLLVGDWCYAAGLCEVAEHGTLEDVETLAALVADVSARDDAPEDQHEAHWDDALRELGTRS